MRPRKGPPLAVIVSLWTDPGGCPEISWCRAVCSESTGTIRAPGGLGEGGHELPADDQRLLVGEGEVDPLPERGHRRAEAGGADEGVQHEVGFGLDHQPHEALGTAEDLAVGPRLRRAGGGVRVGQRDPPDAVVLGLLEQLLP